MTDTTRFVRRNRVDETLASAIAIMGAGLAVAAGAEPTGTTAIDVVLVAAFSGLVIWASASAPWWAVSAAAGIAAAVAFDPIIAAIGFAGFVIGLWIGIRRRNLAVERAVVGAIAVNVLIRSELGGFLGLSAIIGVAVCIGLFVLGVRRRPRAVRRPAWIAGAVVGIGAVVALLGAGVVAVSTRSDLQTGTTRARAGIQAMKNGDYDEAAEHFASAGRAFDRVDSQLGGPIAAPALLVPGVAQNVAAGADLAAAASEAMTIAADAVLQVDPDALTVVDGSIDLDAVRAVEQPLANVQEALDGLRSATAAVDSPWLVAPIQSELGDLEAELDENQARLDDAIAAVGLAPQMLGGDGQRNYLVLFTTPVEARGLTGFPGNYAVLTVDDGDFEVTALGRSRELSSAAYPDARCDACPQEVMDRYGRFGLNRGTGEVGEHSWTSVTLPAHFPYVGISAADLFAQTGGPEIDGVIAMDPYVMQALMQYTGPIELDELGIVVEPSVAAHYLLSGQYDFSDETLNEERVEALDTLGQQVITELLASSLPAPSQLARDLGPLVDEQRLLMWSADPDEQALLEQVGIDGSLPALGDDGGFSVMVSNAGHSKIDVFLHRTVDVAVQTTDDGSRTLVADVTLTNNAPAGGLPDYVIGNHYGYDKGTSYLWINFFGPDSLATATRDGEPLDLTGEPEAGWTAYPHYEVLGPGESVTFQLVFALGPAADGVDEPVRWTQPLAERLP